MTDDPLITISDMRKLFCVKGIRKVFDEGGGDFSRFLKHGARASELRGRGFDANLDRVLDVIRQKGHPDGR